MTCLGKGKKSISTFPPSTSKSGKPPFFNFLNRAFYLPEAVSKAVLLQ